MLVKANATWFETCRLTYLVCSVKLYNLDLYKEYYFKLFKQNTNKNAFIQIKTCYDAYSLLAIRISENSA